MMPLNENIKSGKKGDSLNIKNNLHELSIIEEGLTKTYTLSHIFDLFIEINDFEFENKTCDNIKIHVRPTNHVYSRKFNPETDSKKELEQTGELIIKYEHYENNPTTIKINEDGFPVISTDVRVFCPEKYNSSHNIPYFVKNLTAFPKEYCVLANKGDDRTCLTGLFKFPESMKENNCFIVFLKLHRLNSRELSMVIETAFIVTNDDLRAKRILSTKGGKPFLVVLKNIFAKRLPFDGPTKRNSKNKYKKLKKQRHKK